MIYKDRDEFLELIDKLNLKIGCEIGVFRADYSLKILEKTNLSKLYLIDYWQHIDNYIDINNHDNSEFDLIFEEVKNKTKIFNDRVELVRDLSENAVKKFNDDFFDFVYIDADHSYEASKKDIISWYNKVKPGGILAGHDYVDGNLPQGVFGVKSSVDEFVEKNKLVLHITGENEWKTWFIIKPENKKFNIILHCTENYYETSLNLIKTLNIFHNNFNFYLYEVNFKKVPDIENVSIITLKDTKIGEINFKDNINDMYHRDVIRAVFLKSKVILHTLKELKLKEAIYLDSDLLPTRDISCLFDYIKLIKNYPLIQLGPAEYLMVNGRGNPFTENGFDETKILEYPLMNSLKVSMNNRTHYSISPVLLYNENCLEFIEEYDKINDTSSNLNVEESKYFFPFVDETTINVLLWKYNYTDRLPFLQININNLNEVEEFFHSNYEKEKAYSVFTRIPSKYDKPNKIFFHGIKNKTSLETYNVIKNFYIQNDNFIITCNRNENKTYINYKYDIEVNVLLYDWNPTNNNKNLIYQTISHFNNNRFWYSTAKNLNELNGLKIEIKYNNRIIREEYFNFQEQIEVKPQEEKSKYKKIVLISSYCDTDEKINILKTNIDTIKNLGLDIMLNSPISLPLDVINKCDYFFLTKDNPILEWPQKAVYSWRKIEVNDKEHQLNVCLQDYGWANIYQIKKLSEFALTYDYDYFYHIIYDLIIDDVAINGFKSEKKCNFYHFHEHNVSLHFMIFDKEHMIKFLSQLTLENYLDIGGIAEQWLDRLLQLNRFDYQIENSYVDDKILFHRNINLFNSSKIEGLSFFIIKNDADLSNIQLFFYNNTTDNMNIDIKINNDITNYNVSNGNLIDLGYNKENIINTIVEYNNNSQHITDDIKNIIHNTISI